METLLQRIDTVRGSYLELSDSVKRINSLSEQIERIPGEQRKDELSESAHLFHHYSVALSTISEKSQKQLEQMYSGQRLLLKRNGVPQDVGPLLQAIISDRLINLEQNHAILSDIVKNASEVGTEIISLCQKDNLSEEDNLTLYGHLTRYASDVKRIFTNAGYNANLAEYIKNPENLLTPPETGQRFSLLKAYQRLGSHGYLAEVLRNEMRVRKQLWQEREKRKVLQERYQRACADLQEAHQMISFLAENHANQEPSLRQVETGFQQLTEFLVNMEQLNTFLQEGE